MRISKIIISLFVLQLTSVFAQEWNPNIDENTFKNPIIFADYSDPDVVQVGADFYMTASSFNCIPALPVLHSNDLVNWELINHAIKTWPDDYFDVPQHGNGVWAPCIRYHDGELYIYYGDPDQGIFMVKTKDPRGEWEPPVLVKNAKGNIDSSPLWDDDGKVYLVHAFAHSRAGVKSLLQVNELNKEGTGILDKGTIVFDGHKEHPTIEGPKFYKRNGYYYIFAPGGGVAQGWQTVLRSKNIYGPYEDKIVLAQGNTAINGPHQGALLELESGESWFIHFQERQPYGRIVHLQPVKWIDDWPVMGNDPDGDGTGEPVLEHKKPNVGKIYPEKIPATTDEFNSERLGLQWQWHAHPKSEWASLSYKKSTLRLFPRKMPKQSVSLWDAPHLLLQKLPASSFTIITKLSANLRNKSSKAGLLMMGRDYAYISIAPAGDGLNVSQVICKNADQGAKEPVANATAEVHSKDIYLRVNMKTGGECTFSYSVDGKKFTVLGEKFQAREGKWIGAKVGLFASKSAGAVHPGYVDVDYFRFD